MPKMSPIYHSYGGDKVIIELDGEKWESTGSHFPMAEKNDAVRAFKSHLKYDWEALLLCDGEKWRIFRRID